MPSITKELLEDMYWNQWLSLSQIAKKIGRSPSTVLRMMRQVNIQLRGNKGWPRIKIEPQMLRRLYWKEGMPLPKIAEKLKVSIPTVRQWMVKFGIPRRRGGEANLKYFKLPFSGSPVDMAYLLGLRAGDLSAGWRGKRVRVTLGTTHQAMIDLFDVLFSKYGHVIRCPVWNQWRKSFAWRVFVDLDASFSFMVEKPQSIKPEIKRNTHLFLAFLAGYVDSEGSLVISRSSVGTTVFTFLLGSEDYNLLKDIYDKLIELGYHLTLALAVKKGAKKGFSTFSNDFWQLGLSRKNEVLQLVQQLPMRHNEKTRRRQLMFKVVNETKWDRVKDKVDALRMRIKREVKYCIHEAALVHARKHPEKMEPGICGVIR